MPLRALGNTVQAVPGTGARDVLAGLTLASLFIGDVLGSNGSEDVVAAIDNKSNILRLQRPGQARIMVAKPASFSATSSGGVGKNAVLIGVIFCSLLQRYHQCLLRNLSSHAI